MTFLFFGCKNTTIFLHGKKKYFAKGCGCRIHFADLRFFCFIQEKLYLPLKIFLSSIKKSPKTLRTENSEDTPPLTRARHRSRSVSIFSSTSLNAQTGIHSRTKPQPVCKDGDGAATKIMTLQCAVYIVRSKGDRGDIIREVPIGDTVMEDEPYG